MVIPKSEIHEFSQFLAQEYNARPTSFSGEDGELLQAIVGTQLLVVFDLDNSGADVWCSDSDSLTEIWSAWCGHSQPT